MNGGKVHLSQAGVEVLEYLPIQPGALCKHVLVVTTAAPGPDEGFTLSLDFEWAEKKHQLDIVISILMAVFF